MAEFDDRWRRLVDAARPALAPIDEASPERVRALAALARQRPEPRPFRRVERGSLLALAALLLVALASLAPWQPELRDALADARADLAVLPSRIPRPPHPPSASRTLTAIPDLFSFLDLSPAATESQP